VPPADQPEADILVSDDERAALAVYTADCVPLLMADRRTGAIAAAHAGWRGLAAGVPARAVEALAREFGSRPADIVAAIGPSISAARYEVGADVRERFAASGRSSALLARWFADADRSGHWLFDGWQSTRDQLEAAGVPAGRIYTAGMCTASDPELFCSYRRDGKGAGRLAAVIRPRQRPAESTT
jgi:YfiH family protein